MELLADRIADTISSYYRLHQTGNPTRLRLSPDEYNLLVDLLHGLSFQSEFLQRIFNRVNLTPGRNQHLELAPDEAIMSFPIRFRGPAEYFFYDWTNNRQHGRYYVILTLSTTPVYMFPV